MKAFEPLTLAECSIHISLHEEEGGLVDITSDLDDKRRFENTNADLTIHYATIRVGWEEWRCAHRLYLPTAFRDVKELRANQPDLVLESMLFALSMMNVQIGKCAALLSERRQWVCATKQ